MEFDELLNLPPYSLDREEKGQLLGERLEELTELHRENCREYDRVLDLLQDGFFQGPDGGSAPNRSRNGTWPAKRPWDCPFLPVRMFKDMELKSVPDEEVFKTMTSSGTTGQQVSKIFLDRETSSWQQKTLVKIVKDFTGSARMPMLVIDSPSVIKDRRMFSARGAGILGFSIFASDRKYALHEDMSLDLEGILAFLEKHRGERILLFGFTFMIWQHFYQELAKHPGKVDLSQGILIHGGGWKKLQKEKVAPETFRKELEKVCGISRIHDYYGMVEQTGCIYMECEEGHLHASIFSDVITRKKEDFALCPFGEEGIIQVVSAIPESYPGHSILTEDMGIILGEDDCPCGRLGKYFQITGRIKHAEVRGCSDTYEQK